MRSIASRKSGNERNPRASYDDHVKGLTGVLKTNLFGIDNNPKACRITAFSLYMAFLDQLSRPDIRRVLRRKTECSPRLWPRNEQQGDDYSMRRLF